MFKLEKEQPQTATVTGGHFAHTQPYEAVVFIDARSGFVTTLDLRHARIMDDVASPITSEYPPEHIELEPMKDISKETLTETVVALYHVWAKLKQMSPSLKGLDMLVKIRFSRPTLAQCTEKQLTMMKDGLVENINALLIEQQEATHGKTNVRHLRQTPQSVQKNTAG